MEDKIKTVFRGKVVRKIYYMNSNKYTYDGSYYGEPYIKESEVVIKYENFYECEIERPPFDIQETIYINDLDIEVYLTEKMRSTDGKYIYRTNHTLEVIEDEATEQSKKKAEEELSEEIIKYLKCGRKNKKKWYMFWK